MTMILTNPAVEVFAPTTGGGEARGANMGQAQGWGIEIERYISAAFGVTTTVQGGWDASAGTFPGGGTAAKGDAYLVTTAGTVNGQKFRSGDMIIAIATNAATTTYAGNWVRVAAALDPVVFVTDSGAGTANAIQVSAANQVSGDGGQFLSGVIFEANTSGVVTITITDITGAVYGPFTIETASGNPPAVGGLSEGLSFSGQIVGSSFVLLSDQATSALLAAAEAAQAAAEAAALEAAGHATGAIDYVYLEGATSSLAKAVDDLVYVPVVGSIKRVSARVSGADYAPANWICTATGQSSVALPGAMQTDGTFAILGYRFKFVAAAYASENDSRLSPVYIDQFFRMFGRGMLAAETVNVASESAVTSTSAADTNTLTAATVTYLLAGATCVIKHDNGIYLPYFILDKTGSQITVSPPLKYATTAAGGAKIERLWYNRAHPGKFYFRHIAQVVANSKEYEHEIGDQPRYFYTRFNGHGSIPADTLTASGAAVTYYPAANASSLGTAYPNEFILDETPFIEFTAPDQYVQTANFEVRSGRDCILRFAYGTRHTTLNMLVRVLDQDDETCLEYTIAPSTLRRPQEIHTVPFRLKGTSTSARVQFYVVSATGSGSFVINFIDVFTAYKPMSKLIRPGPDRPNLVYAGDSYAEGDIGSTAEREPPAYQASIEVPFCDVFNGGSGGKRSWEINGALFDSNIAAYDPDYVVIFLGANDVYNPWSGTIDPTALDFFAADIQRLISDIQAIGAKPIIMGCPALAEQDEETAYVTWQLNDRARLFVRDEYKRFTATDTASVPIVGTIADGSYAEPGGDASGYWVKYGDGRMTISREASVDLTISTTQSIAAPAGLLTSYPITGSIVLKSIVSADSHPAFKSKSLRITSAGWDVVIHTPVAGPLSETCAFEANGYWKTPGT